MLGLAHHHDGAGYVTLHNIPEGMAVGVVYAGFLSGNTQITAASALVLSLGIAIQNFPEGAIISMPLRRRGTQGPSVSRRCAFRRCRAYRRGADASRGAACDPGAVSAELCSGRHALCGGGGVDSGNVGAHSNLGTVFFAVGFSVMMVLDVALG